MSKSTGWVEATAGQPVPTISWVKSSNFTVPVFTLDPLLAGERGGQEIDAIGVSLL